jgi:hypothetical protein
MDYALWYKVVPVLNQAPHHEDILGIRKIQLHGFLISSLDGGWSASSSGRLSPVQDLSVSFALKAETRVFFFSINNSGHETVQGKAV